MLSTARLLPFHRRYRSDLLKTKVVHTREPNGRIRGESSRRNRFRLRYDDGMPDELFETDCPCCGATLEIDAANRIILSHQVPAPETTTHGLHEAVQQLKAAESGRDEQFRQQVAAKHRYEEEAGKRFDGLLKKARAEGPVKPALRDIDLD